MNTNPSHITCWGARMDITGKIKLTIRNVIPENSQEMPLNFPL